MKRFPPTFRITVQVLIIVVLGSCGAAVISMLSLACGNSNPLYAKDLNLH